MNEAFWTTVSAYTDARWWFGFPAALALVGALLLLVWAMTWLQQRNTASVALTVIALSGAVALLVPGALIAWRPTDVLGVDAQSLASVSTESFPAAAEVLEQTMQMGYIGSGLLLVSSLGVVGLLGSRRSDPCPACGRERHQSWGGVCPECQLLPPVSTESPLMGLGDLGAGALAINQFGGPAQTEILDIATSDTAWLEIVDGPSGIGERFAIAARLTIGRDPSHCRLVLDDDTASSRHAYIERDHQSFVVYDWGSRNGTYVNDQLVGHRVLHQGDLIRIGRVVLRFSMPTDAADSLKTEISMPTVSGAWLVALEEGVDGKRFPIKRLDVRIGRGKQNDIVLDAPTVSRHHANVRFDGSQYYLVDADASNGTWLDETRVFGSTVLQSGQIIRLGQQQIRFELEEGQNVATS
ncbi:MAG: FHA domain-containing protein [Chloroflexales bacterium]|nr:FHA domain-containing protein [Chloroflexales bacterium]